MSLFGLKKKAVEERTPETVKTVKVSASATLSRGGGIHVRKGVSSSIIICPRVTEKTHALSEGSNVYVFDVKQGSTKGMVDEAIRDLYKISPVKVSIVKIPKKSRFVRGKAGFTGGGRKAYVYLKKGEKLE